MKKYLHVIGIAFIAFCLTGCLDSEENVTINANGSGVYKTTVDMSGLFDMMQMAAMMDTSASSQLKELSDKNVDSTILLAAFADTSKALTAEEKALVHDGTMHMTINQKNKIFKIVMNYPFKKMEDVQRIMELQQSGKTFNLMQKAKENPALQGMGNEGFPSTGEITNTSFKKGLIERKVDLQKLDDLKKGEGYDQVEKAGSMLEGVNFTTVIRLPRAVRSSSGSKLSLSDDKKTVRVKYNLLDMIKDPKVLEFKVEY